jgi:hypothetical protein
MAQGLLAYMAGSMAPYILAPRSYLNDLPLFPLEASLFLSPPSRVFLSHNFSLPQESTFLTLETWI